MGRQPERFTVRGPTRRGLLLIEDRREHVIIDAYDDTPDGRAEAYDRVAEENRLAPAPDIGPRWQLRQISEESLLLVDTADDDGIRQVYNVIDQPYAEHACGVLNAADDATLRAAEAAAVEVEQVVEQLANGGAAT